MRKGFRFDGFYLKMVDEFVEDKFFKRSLVGLLYYTRSLFYMR